MMLSKKTIQLTNNQKLKTLTTWLVFYKKIIRRPNLAALLGLFRRSYAWFYMNYLLVNKLVEDH